MLLSLVTHFADSGYNNMNRGRMETEHSRLHEVYVKFFEICQKDVNTGWVKDWKFG